MDLSHICKIIGESYIQKAAQYAAQISDSQRALSTSMLHKQHGKGLCGLFKPCPLTG
jgi:hypothetical protein